jgi:hypothetical protein
MALAKDLVAVGIPPVTALGIGGQTNTALAATNSTQTGATAGTAVTVSNAIVTGADGTKCVVLPASQPGESILLVNNSGSALPVFPPVGAAIVVPGTGMGSANAAYSQTANSVAMYVCLSSTQWAVNKSA